MTVLRLVLLISLVVLTAKAQQNSVQQSGTQPRSGVPASCPVTTPPAHPFTPPAWSEPGDDSFWLGSEKLWTEGSKSGVWEWEPHKPGHEHEVQPLTVKISWGSVDYYWRKEPRPNLTLTGRRLDGEAPPLLLMPMTNIAGPNARHGFMLSGVYVPTPGCWEITGEYNGQKLSFVVWVQPVKQVKPVKQGNQ
jgi:hypothetical protein